MRAKRFEYSAAVDRAGRISIEGGETLELSDAWTPEHIALAGLARCSLASLAHHAGRAGLAVTAGAAASGAVTRREDDGRYAIVEIDLRLDVELDPLPAAEELDSLLAKAERDCFISASLRAVPRFAWRVNGVER